MHDTETLDDGQEGEGRGNADPTWPLLWPPALTPSALPRKRRGGRGAAGGQGVRGGAGRGARGAVQRDGADVAPLQEGAVGLLPEGGRPLGPPKEKGKGRLHCRNRSQVRLEDFLLQEKGGGKGSVGSFISVVHLVLPDIMLKTMAGVV